MLDRKACEDLLSRILNRSRADETHAVLQYSHSAALRVGGNRPQQLFEAEDGNLQLTVRKDNHYATATCNDLSDDGIAGALDDLLSLALNNPASPEIVHFPASAVVIEAPLHNSGLDTSSYAMLSSAAGEIIDAVQAEDLIASGSITASENAHVVANSNGLFLYQPSSLLHAQFRVYNTGGDSTGYNQHYTHGFEHFRPATFIGRAVQTCLAWKNPIELDDVSRMTTIVEPEALADLMLPFMQQFSHQAVLEDRSFIRRLDGSTFLGHRMLDSSISIRSNAFDTVLPASPFTNDGYEVRAHHWVKDGVINQLSLDPAEALRYQREPVPLPTNWIVESSAEAVEDIVAGSERALLLQGFSTISQADPKNCLLTGSTRDGLFLVENGSITAAVKNLVFRETPLYLFRELEAVGRSRPVSPTHTFFPMLLPTIRSKDVMFTQHSGLL